MARVSINPKRFMWLEEPTYKRRRTVGGKRRTVREPLFRPEMEATAQGGFLMPKDLSVEQQVEYLDTRGVNLASMVGISNRKAYEKAFNKVNALGVQGALNNPYRTLTDAINGYYLSNVGAPVSYIYSRNSKVMQGTSDLLAVKLKGGRKGWLTLDGRFIAQDEVYNLMKGLDGTMASGIYDFSFEEVWENMSASQRADFIDAVKDIDWDVFWKVKYKSTDPLSSEWIESMDTVANALISALS